MELAIPNLNLFEREINIPRYPNDPLRKDGCETFTVNLKDFVYVNENILNMQLQYVTSWLFSINYWMEITEIAVAAVAYQRIKHYQQTSSYSVSFIKEHVLYQDYDFITWKEQLAWLKSAAKTLDKMIRILQSYNANKRAELNVSSNL